MNSFNSHVGKGVRRLLRACSAEADGPGLWPKDVARLYGLQTGGDGDGQCVAVIALGGGYLPDDLHQAMQSTGLPPPFVVDCSVSSVQNSFGTEPEADKELALDLQVLAAITPAARIAVYFAPNSLQGLADAVAAAVSDATNRPSVVSISWGSAERFWDDAVRNALENTLRIAKARGVTVVVASGDLLATAGLMDHTANVMYPASSPQVLACGGTSMIFDPETNSLMGEEVWSDGFVGTGGGVSAVFGSPVFQQATQIPISVTTDRAGRGMPDVAAAAAPVPGYRIVLGGEVTVRDGTSAATPLWAALVVLANAARGRPVGFINEHLYRNPQLCRDVTRGNNRRDGIGYDAMPGWDACTGLGTPWAAEVIESLIGMPLPSDRQVSD